LQLRSPDGRRRLSIWSSPGPAGLKPPQLARPYRPPGLGRPVGDPWKYRSVELQVVPVDNPRAQPRARAKPFHQNGRGLHERWSDFALHPVRAGLLRGFGPCLVRRSGNDDDLVQLATVNAERIGAGHSFIVVPPGAYPLNVLNAGKARPRGVPRLLRHRQPVSVVVAVTGTGRASWRDRRQLAPGRGVRQGRADRKGLMRAIGYKL